MPISLSKAERKLLENTTVAARVLADSACRAALENLSVHEKDYRAHMTVEQRLLRNRLRARGRALGDKREEHSGTQSTYHLTELCAYEHWHRLLFTRFLTENHLLITDEANGSVPITLEECEELAPELGARDGFDLACRFASRTLPGVFRRDDPVLDLPIALNDQVELRKLLAILPAECFRTDDALGWTYQFWQAQRKDEVNRSGKKIGANELAPVTQLFTEDYMVEFLLHNTLGAWWAGKLGPIRAATEEEARARVALPAREGIPTISWSYLRFVQDETSETWLPAAGTFDSWPKSANLLRLLDPSMGSGHFLVFALPLLVRLRMEEEQFEVKSAVVAVLKDNVHGLELDERCTQIAAFNVALTAWKLAGYQGLPPLHLACSGLMPSATEAEWLMLAGNDDRLQRGMKRLYDLFKEAPILGSLINPRAQRGSFIEADFQELVPLLAAALGQGASHNSSFEVDAAELGVVAQGLTKAAEMLGAKFTLVVTNVPYLGRSNQAEALKDYCGRVHPNAKSDLATCFIERCLTLCTDNVGSTALVTPQNWLFLSSFKHLRQRLLRGVTWDACIRLGPHAFETIGGEVVNVALVGLTQLSPLAEQAFMGLDVSALPGPTEKGIALHNDPVLKVSQAAQLGNPDGIIQVGGSGLAKRVSDYAFVRGGTTTSDSPLFRRFFWEVTTSKSDWAFQQGTVESTQEYAGRELVLLWQGGAGELSRRAAGNGATIAGREAWGRKGIAISKMNNLQVTLYTGEVFENVAFMLVPRVAADLTAFWCFCSSSGFRESVREVNQALCVDPGYYEKAPFDLAHWQRIAAEQYPNGLPLPYSDDPTQWLFGGHPKSSAQPLHVAVARLVGYLWPRQTGSSFTDCPALGADGLEGLADRDGIVCLPPVNREQPAANRLRQLLTAAIGPFDERVLIASAGPKGSKSRTLEDWLRDEFFEQHAKLFHDRPFIWHLWDGRPDGFHALVNYHKLDHATLQKLTYSYLGNWIQQQDEDAKADKPGAASRLGAARALQTKLAAILQGETPLDIFVRWKPLKEQALGWHPDLNDGVHQNIRPFLLAGDVGKRGAGLFRNVPLALKDKDRGNEPQRPKEDYPWFWCEDKPGIDPTGGKSFVGTRWNNVHLTLDKKRKSRA